MRVYIGFPLNALIGGALEHIGNRNTLLVAPRKLARFSTDWRSFLEEVVGSELPNEPTPAQIALMAQVCERVLDESSYFRKVRHMPRFHQQVARQIVRFGMDGLTPELLEHSASLVLSDSQLLALAGLELPELAEEWVRKTHELCLLWREWEQALRQRSLRSPAQLWWDAVERIEQGIPRRETPVLIVGMTELSAVEIALLHALDKWLPLNLALLLPPEECLHAEPTFPPSANRSATSANESGTSVTHSRTSANESGTSVTHSRTSANESGTSVTHSRTSANESGTSANRSATSADESLRSGNGEWRRLFAFSQRLFQRLQAHLKIECVPIPSSLPSLEVSLFDVPNPLTEVETIARHLWWLHTKEGIPYEEMLVVARQPAKVFDSLEVLFARYGVPLSAEVAFPLTHSPYVRFILEGLNLLTGMRTGAEWLAWLENPLLGDGRERVSLLLRRIRHTSERSDRWLVRALAHPAVQADTELYSLLTRLRGVATQLEGKPAEGTSALIGMVSECAGASELATLQELVSAYADTLNALPAKQAVLLLERLCAGTDYLWRSGSGGVRLVSLEQADLVGGRGVWVMEVLEGVIPRRHPDDPFLRETERRALQQVLQRTHPLVSLPLRSDYQAGEPMLFYRALTSATERVFLSYPRTQNDTEALPSFYLEWLRPAEETLPAPARELPLLLNDYRYQFIPLSALVPEEALHPYDLSLQQGVSYEEPPLELQEPRHRERVAQTERPFSITELESLARCPFQYWAQHILKIRRPHRGLRLTQIGTVVHRALHRTLKKPPASDDPEAWIQLLHHHLERLLQEEDFDLSAWQLQVLNAYALRLLILFAQREVRYRQQFGLKTVRLEWAFGGIPEAVDEEVEGFEGKSTPEPFRYALGDGRILHLRGVIDRLDICPNRSVAMVLDYKLGSAPEKNAILNATALQGLLYMEVMRATAKGVPHVVLAYDQLTSGRRVRYIPYDRALVDRFKKEEWEGSFQECVILSPREWEQIRQRLRERLRQLLNQLQSATIEPQPGNYCETCAFSDLCRRAYGVHFADDGAPEAGSS